MYHHLATKTSGVSMKNDAQPWENIYFESLLSLLEFHKTVYYTFINTFSKSVHFTKFRSSKLRSRSKKQISFFIP